MRPRRFVCAIALVSALTFSAGAVMADQELKVDISPASDYNSDITLDALKSGKRDYTVSGMGKTFNVRLSKQQIADVLNGTTVMVDSSKNGDSSVRVSLTAEGEPESSGW